MGRWSRIGGAWLLGLAVLVAEPHEAWAQGPSAGADGKEAALAEAKQRSAQVERLYGEGKYAEAMPLAELVLSLRERALGPKHPDTAAALNTLAELYQKQGAYGKAEPLYRRALRIREKALGKEHPTTAASLHSLASLYDDQGAYGKAEPLYQRTLTVREKALGPEHPDTASALNDLAVLSQHQGAYAKAESFFLRALRIRENALAPEHPDTAASLYNLATLYNGQGAYDKAEPFYRRALTIWEKALGPEHPDTATTLHNLAMLYQKQGAYDKAEPLYRRALKIREKALGPEHPQTATAFHNLASLYQAQDAYDKAELLYQRALAVWEKALGPEHPTTATTLHNLARLYQAQGAHEKAEPLFLRALTVREKALGPEHSDTAVSLHHLAELYRAQGAYGKAEPLSRRALRIREKALGQEHPDTALSLHNLAALYDDQGVYEKAEPLLLRAVRIREKALGPEHPDTAFSLHHLAELYRAQGTYEKAEPLYRRALRIREKALGPEHPATASSLHNLARLYQAQGDYALARPLYARAASARERQLRAQLAALPEVRQRLLLDRARLEVQTLASFHALSAPNDPDALRLALTAALERKGRGLDELAAARRALRRTLTPALQGEFDALTQKQADLVALRDAPLPAQPDAQRARAEARRALEDEVERREGELARTSAAFNAKALPVTPERVQQALPPDAVLVEFVRYHRFDPKDAAHPWKEARYVAYVLRRQGPPRWADLGEATPLEADVEAARRALTTLEQDAHGAPRPAADARPALRALGRRLLAPLRQALGGTLPAHLLLAPDGPLHLVPFGALLDDDGHYLLERALVTYLGSGRDLLRLGEHEAPRSAPLVLAAPDYGAGPWTPLRGAAAEANALREHFPSAELVVGAKARKEVLTAAHAPLFVHLATHGFFRPPASQLSRPAGKRSPFGLRGLEPEALTPPPDEGDAAQDALDAAGLVFAGANARPDAVLTAREATRLDLQGTQLVVLSACQTGLGQLRDGEGVYGLRRALAIAGAETHVFGLWGGSDQATRALMGDYYGTLRAGAGRSEALRRAQLGLLRRDDYKHPFYWAAFAPSGDWRPLQPPTPPPVSAAKLPPRAGSCGCRTAGSDGAAGGAGVVTLALVAGVRRVRRRARLAAR